MARKPKLDTGKHANGQRMSTVHGVSSATGEQKPVGAPLKSKGRRPASKKKTVRANVTDASRETPSASSYEPSDKEIAVRAYFIAERRMELSLEGNSDQDWLEARRQLVEEGSRSSS